MRERIPCPAVPLLVRPAIHGHAYPPLSPVRAPQAGRPPSLHRLRRRYFGLVRLLLWYYGAVRLPENVHTRRAAKGLLRPFRSTARLIIARHSGSLRGLPVSVHRVSTHARGLRLRGVLRRFAGNAVPGVAFPLAIRGGTPEEVISELDSWPMCGPVDASPTRLPASAHDSRSRRFAIHFLCGSFTRYSLPALTGAFTMFPNLPPFTVLASLSVLGLPVPRPNTRADHSAGIVRFRSLG
jgi:hypothetical protein